ncbi:heparan sulfate 2-O-sulfotransferase 1 [Trichonephila clavata]|uniref:Heparan sulfate 2-O-sulfotransferase 1 n=1 Tax=Trichonephila clavata TaxID=2740835 RepID=A0A8X6KI93_TRICU|nr:heparan sulfate 2-O-sulfotransferase 1 [Trichonephila clavata]
MWLQVPFFCGHYAECWIPGSEWALAQAKRNLAEHFLLVGVTEELQDFIALLEAALPRYFRGATNLFVEGKKSHLRKTFNKTYPSPDTVAKIQASRIWQMENEFYEFVLQQFHFIRKRTLTVRDGVISDKGQQFMYEKIRPREEVGKVIMFAYQDRGGPEAGEKEQKTRWFRYREKSLRTNLPQQEKMEQQSVTEISR